MPDYTEAMVKRILEDHAPMGQHIIYEVLQSVIMMYYIHSNIMFGWLKKLNPSGSFLW